MENEKQKFYLLLYTISLFLMGSNGIVASFISLSSIEIVFIRTSIGSIIFIIISLLYKERYDCLKNKHDAIFLILSGLALGGGWIFLFEAYRIIGVGVSTLLYYLGPIIAMLVSPLFFDVKFTKAKIIGATAVFVGLILLNKNVAVDPTKIKGIVYGIISGILYAVMVICNKKVNKASDIENTTCQLVTSFILVSAFLLFTKGIHIKVADNEWLPVLWIGIVNTGIVCYLYYSSIRKLPVPIVAIFSYLDPVFAVILSAFILHETLTAIQVLGVMLIIAGATFSQES